MAKKALGLLLPSEYIKPDNGRHLRRCHVDKPAALKLGIVIGYTTCREPTIAKDQLTVWVDRVRVSRKAGVIRLQVLIGRTTPSEKHDRLKIPTFEQPIRCELIFDVTTGICDMPDELVA